MTTAGARRLVAAMLLRAVKDAQEDDSLLGAPARRWLAEEGMAWAEWLGLDSGRLSKFLTSLGPPRQPALL